MQPSFSPADQPIVNIVGEKVALGPLRRDLMPLYDRWFNDFAAGLPYFLQLRPHTREAREAWYERLAKEEPDTVDFLIYERATMRPIGKTALDQIDLFNRTASFGIIIGEKDCWGKGYGTETTILMLDYGFTLLGLHNIQLTVDAYNERAIRAYRRAGFREFGRRREARRRGNRAHDVVYMDCLVTEFRSPLLRRDRQSCDRTHETGCAPSSRPVNNLSRHARSLAAGRTIAVCRSSSEALFRVTPHLVRTPYLTRWTKAL